MIEALYGAAVRVPADDDIPDLEVVERVFKHGREVPVVNRDDVADVALDEDLPGLCTGDALRVHTRVGAPYPENHRVLT